MLPFLPSLTDMKTQSCGGLRLQRKENIPQNSSPSFIRLSLTGAPAQVFDIDLLLLHARRLSDQTGVVVGVPVGGAHGVFIVPAAVDVTYAPEEGRSGVRTVSHRNMNVLFCSVSATAALISIESVAEAH